MIEQGLYYANSDFKKMITSAGGQWKDNKHRPLVCMLKSRENENLYWAVPMGKTNHRSKEQMERIKKYMAYDERDIRSSYYHIGRTTSDSIFFISDAVPITDKYIESEHKGADKKPFVIKNKKLINELQRKLAIILNDEKAHPNKYRQHITDVKNYLLNELQQEKAAAFSSDELSGSVVSKTETTEISDDFDNEYDDEYDEELEMQP